MFTGLTQPTAVRFATDGRVFVAEKSGIVKVFANLTDTTPTVFADLRTKVHNFWDRGLLGLALDPNFPANPYVYVLYTYDAAIGGTAPRWGTAGGTSDGCPTPPGATADGCVVSGRLSRLQAAGNVDDRRRAGADRGLVPAVPEPLDRQPGVRRRRRALRRAAATAPASTSPTTARTAARVNPCGDPPGGVGGTQTAADRRGRRAAQPGPAHDGRPDGPRRHDLRVDPATGAGAARQPARSAAAIANARRIVAYGLRNPFRITIRPGTNEIWVGDVGWNDWEEINRIVNPTDADGRELRLAVLRGRRPPVRLRRREPRPLREPLRRRRRGGRRRRTSRYRPQRPGRRPATSCPTGGSSIAGLSFAFYDRRLVPGRVRRRAVLRRLLARLHLGDAARRRRPAGPAEASRRSSPARPNPVDLEIGPGGDLFYVDFDGGTIRRIRYFGQNQPPIAVASASPTSGAAPLTVAFDGTALERPRRRRAHLRLGPRRRRRLRRLSHGDRQLHLHRRRAPISPRCGSPTPRSATATAIGHRSSPGNTPPTAVDRHRRPAGRRGRSATRSPSRGHADRRAGRHPRGVGARVVADPAALPDARATSTRSRPSRASPTELRRARPRVPVAPGAAPHSNGLRRV